MAFPERPWWLPVRLELAFGADPVSDPGTWAWTDVSPDLDPEAQIQIRRGRPNEAGQVSPASASPRLVNNSGAYTPDHPASPHYPHIHEGVPARISVQAGGPYLLVPDVPGARARTASSPALDVTGDIDIRIELAADRLPRQGGGAATGPWQHTTSELIGRFNNAASQDAWRLLILSTGQLSFTWSEDGTFNAALQRASTEAVPYTSGSRVALRVTLDVDNGAGGHEVRFFTGRSVAGPWRQLGDAIVTTGTTSIHAPINVPLDIADIDFQGFASTPGRYYRVELRDGIDGTVLTSPDFTTMQPGDTSLVDPQGHTWTLSGGAEISDWRYRLVGTVDSWAPTWPWGDLSDPTQSAERPGEARVDLTISGILRRLGQGQKALESTLRRRIPSFSPLGYWPMEEDRGATQAYSPIEGVQPARLTGFEFGSDSDLAGSSPLPRLTGDSSLHCSVPGATADGWHAEAVYRLDALPATEQTFLEVRVVGSVVAGVRVRVSTAGIRIQARDADDNVLTEFLSTNPLVINAFATGEWGRIQMFTSDAGGDTNLVVAIRDVGANTFRFLFTTGAGATPGRITAVRSTWGTDFQGMALGHVGAWDIGGASSTSPGVLAYADADDGFLGEPAVTRMRRLAEEEALPMSVLGVAAESTAMGPQRPATLLTLLQECAAADGGILSERREVIGLQYRPRVALYGAGADLELDARAQEITHPFAPILDDQRLRNDITVSRPSGSSARAVDDASVAERGRYDESITVNVATDGQLDGIAYWRLHRGTWPGMRYPAVSTALHIAPETIAGWLDVLEGDRIHVINLPPQHPAGTVDLMVEGLTETLTPTQWAIEANASPGGVWVVGVVGDDDPDDDAAPTHVDTDGSILDGDMDETTAQMLVQTTVGEAWVTTAGPAPDAEAGDLPVDIQVDGEVMTVEGIEPLIWDTFARTETDGWGSTPSSVVSTPVWSISGGAPSERSVTGSAGVVVVNDTAVPRFQFITPWSVPDVELLVAVTPAVLATGAALRPAMLMRVSGASYYLVRLVLGTDGTVGIEAVHTTTSLTGVVATPATYSAGTRLWLRTRIVDQRVQGRVWADGRPEPPIWHVDHTVASAPIASGFVGVTADRATGNTNAAASFAFSDFQTGSPQFFTVERSVNGVTKPHPAGADVRLAEPAIVAL